MFLLLTGGIEQETLKKQVKRGSPKLASRADLTHDKCDPTASLRHPRHFPCLRSSTWLTGLVNAKALALDLPSPVQVSKPRGV